MNKFAKGSVAAGAGLVLLLGGVGTLAYWNSDAELKGGTIDAGELTLTVEEKGWTPEIVHWVPGDSSAYVADLQLTAVGDNIQGRVTFDDEDFIQIVGGEKESAAIDVAEQFIVDVQQVPGTDLPVGVTFDDTTDVFTFDGPVDGTLPVQISVSFPLDENADQNNSQGATVDLTGVNFTATQTDPNGPEGE